MRWFFEGTPSPVAEDWFGQSELATIEETRTDRYLYLPGVTTVGIKIREGLFEIKAKAGPSELARFANGVEGYRAAWIKWSRAVNGLDAQPAGGKETWISVEKLRHLRLFAVSEDRVDEAQSGGFIVGAGCTVELSRLAIDGIPVPWWGVCLEAFDDAGRQRAALERVASLPALGDLGEFLTAESSRSYPEWLNGIERPGQL